MKNILVTGGAGFLGSNLCKMLLTDPNNMVHCVDNLYTGRLSNIEMLLKNSRFVFSEHSVTDPIDTDINFDEIYNAACPASPPAYQFDPIGTTKTCVVGIINLLDLAVKCGAKFLQFSTSEVYGDPEVHPQVECYRGNVNPIGIRSCYDEGKRCAESLCFDYMRVYGIDVKVVRIFNTYGPNMDPKDGRVVSNFIMQALNNESLTVYGDGSQTRSICYVDDLITGIINMMDSKEHGPTNLGNPNEMTVLQLANLIINLTNSESKIIYKELPSDDPIRRKPCINKAMSTLSWKPKVSAEDGLIRTIEYFKSINKRGVNV